MEQPPGFGAAVCTGLLMVGGEGLHAVHGEAAPPARVAVAELGE
ncbi:hypothetical protein [Nocardia sp. IFM 10818]